MNGVQRPSIVEPPDRGPAARSNFSQRVLTLSPALMFVPALVVYAVLAFDPAPEATGGDESRYLASARNILAGEYSTPNMRQLWNGPGYPVLLAAMLLLGASAQALHLMNAVLLYVSLILIHKALSLYTNSLWALLGTTAFAVYWPVFATIDLILTETLAIFLFAASVCFTCRCHADSRLRFTVLASVALASLALTKVILGYVLLAQLLVHGLLWLITRRRFAGRLFAVYAGAMVLCLPYLTYTYSITGRAFYWSTAGGSSLYWMSYPGPETTGEWKSSSTVAANPALLKQHQLNLKGYDFARMTADEKDCTLRSIAVKNVINNPQKYLQNWRINWLRMFFYFPFTRTQHVFSNCRADFPTAVAVCLFAFSIFTVCKDWRHVPLEVHSLLLLEGLYLGASSIASAYPRMFYVSIPVVIFYSTVALSRVADRNREKLAATGATSSRAQTGGVGV